MTGVTIQDVDVHAEGLPVRNEHSSDLRKSDGHGEGLSNGSAQQLKNGLAEEPKNGHTEGCSRSVEDIAFLIKPADGSAKEEANVAGYQVKAIQREAERVDKTSNGNGNDNVASSHHEIAFNTDSAEQKKAVSEEGSHDSTETLTPRQPCDAVASKLSPSLQGGETAKELKPVASKQEEAPHSEEKETAYRQGNWVLTEILILLEGKAKAEEHFSGEVKRSRLSADDKWKHVSEHCRSKGVFRTKEQCRIKWDNMMPDYRKIRDYEEQREGNGLSYFEMEACERRARLLPSNMDSEVYHRIANIQSNKPTTKGGGGGIKKDAREKRLSLQILSSPNGADSPHPISADGEKPVDTPLKQQHPTASPASRKRRKKKPSETNMLESLNKPDLVTKLETKDDSSTEDDTTVMSCRSHQGLPYLYAERSSFPSPQNIEKNGFVSNNRLRFDSRDGSYIHSQNGHYQASLGLLDRGNSTSPFESQDKDVPMQETANSVPNQDAATLAEDRKDARHRELMALEREKIAVFKEATIMMANAMTNAMTLFSKVAEELMLRRH